ncbi:type IV secretion system protein [Escherichia coli]|uniref:type IV secretion system protein n=1 Tax=Escherichia coli TaxID=562 RepID=UPI003D3136C0
MKDKVLSFLFAGIITVTSPSIFASGIPVVDVTAIAKTVEEGLNRAAEAARQLEQLKQQYEQTIRYAEEQKKRLEGFTDFSNGFDSASSYMKDSLSTITNSANQILALCDRNMTYQATLQRRNKNMMQSWLRSNSMKISTMKCRKGLRD